MKRRLLNLASAVSLLLCAAAAALWIHSRGHWASIEWSGPRGYLLLESADGVLSATATHDDLPLHLTASPPGRHGWLYSRWPLRAGGSVPSLFRWRVTRTPPPSESQVLHGGRRMVILSVPDWFLVALTAALPLRWLGLLIEAQLKPTAGHCAACGYNLTGNTTGICPECGSPVEGAEVQRQLRSMRMRLAPLALLLLAPFAGRTLVDQFREHNEWNRLRERQANYTGYVAPANRVVYCEDPAAAGRLVASDTHYRTLGTSTCYVADLGERIPGIHLTRNGGPILFLHGRTSPGGIVRLVEVSIMSIDDAEILCIDEFVPISTNQRDAYQSRQSDVVLRRWPDQRMTLLAGQPDPADRSHFTIAYRVDDQPGALDGWLMDDGSIRMRARNGPAEILAVSPKPLSLMGKWGGTPPRTR